MFNRRPRAPDIDAEEEEQPDHVDKVPVPGCGLEAEVVLFGEMSSQRPEQDHGQEDRTDYDMETVEAGRHEEGRAVDVAGKLELGVMIFIGLERGEEHAEHDG